MSSSRYDRRHAALKIGDVQASLWVSREDDARSPTRHDHDRILYSTFLHRLSDVTQILDVDPRRPEILLHNRLTHSLKSGQLARTIAERVADPTFLDVDGVHAACLGHDLGHPPFGHLGEHELNRLLREEGLDEGFEANAQAFRIVTKLACRHPGEPGLNLTRVTLNGLLKYPWQIGAGASAGSAGRVTGVYPTEQLDLGWARSGTNGKSLTPEAEVSQWCDDATYALHDLEDFYLVGAIELTLIGSSHGLEAVVGSSSSLPPGTSAESLARASERLARIIRRPDRVDITRRYTGSRSQYGMLRLFVSELLTRWLSGVSRRGDMMVFDEGHLAEIQLIKLMVWHLVIGREVVAGSQMRERHLVRAAFRHAMDWVSVEENPNRLPIRLQEALNAAAFDDFDVDDEAEFRRAKLRAVRDFIAGMTERQLLSFVDGEPSRRP